MRQQPRSCHPACDRTTRGFRLHDFVASRTGKLRSNLPDHFEVFRHILQRFRNILTELFQLAAAVWTCFLLRQNLARLTWQTRTAMR
jgi:hypothetical protein